jgi:RNA polymerase sigma-70 factor (ECF subfamily)
MKQDQSALVQKATGGDGAAFGRLVEQYRATVGAIAFDYLGNVEQAQDAVQETFLRAYSGISCLHGAERFGPWLRRIARNVCVDMLRTSRGTAIPLSDTTELCDERAEDDYRRALDRACLMQALGRLSEGKRLAVTLVHVGGYSHEEAADMLGVPVNTVRSRLQSARKQLAREVDMAAQKKTVHEGSPAGPMFGSFVLQAEMPERTGNAGLDAFLFGMVNVLGISLGEYLMSVYLIRSYESEGFSPICFVFRDGCEIEHGRKLWSLVVHLMCMDRYRHRIDPLYRGDERPFRESGNFGEPDRYPCSPLVKLQVKEDSLLLWGTDIRSLIAVPTSAEIRADVLTPPINWMKAAHDAGAAGGDVRAAKLQYPLTEAHPELRDRGRGDLFRVTMAVNHIARALVFLKTGRYVYNQDAIAPEYARAIGGQWSDLVDSVSRPRLGQMTAPEKRKVWLVACSRLTRFENLLLEVMAANGIRMPEHVAGL